MGIKLNYEWPVVGQEKAVKYLQLSVNNRSLTHAYVFFGPEKVGKVHLAKLFARTVLCDNYRKYADNLIADGASLKLPCGECESCREIKKGVFADLYFVERETRKTGHGLKTEITVAQIRDLIERISKRAFHNTYKVVIIPEAEALNQEASNALLKTLEEPTDRTIIILIASARETLLPTILSRSQSVKFSLAPQKAIFDYLINQGAGRDEAHDLSSVCEGRPTVAMQLFHHPEDYAEYRNAQTDWLKIIQDDLVAKMAFAENQTEKASVDDCRLALRRASAVVRDLLLTSLGAEDLAVNAFLRRELPVASRNFQPQQLVYFLKKISQTRQMLDQNVNARLAFENLLI